MRKKLVKQGFTLLELLIVIAIIGSLGAIVTFSFPASQGRARDTHRRNDLKQYQAALESYANSHGGIYPKKSSAVVRPSSMCAAGEALETYSNCSQDPRHGDLGECSGQNCYYNYLSNVAGTDYSLWAALERPADATRLWYIVCSTGITYEGATAPSSGDLCP